MSPELGLDNVTQYKLLCYRYCKLQMKKFSEILIQNISFHFLRLYFCILKITSLNKMRVCLAVNSIRENSIRKEFVHIYTYIWGAMARDVKGNFLEKM
jgi:hypothetical protein